MNNSTKTVKEEEEFNYKQFYDNRSEKEERINEQCDNDYSK